MRIAAASHALAGRLAEAQQVMARMLQFDSAVRLSNLEEILPPFRRLADRANYAEGLRKAGMPE